MKRHKSRSLTLEPKSYNSNHKSHSSTLFNILNKQKKDTEASGKLIHPLKHPPLPFLGSARRWDIWCVCIHPPLYTCHTLEERCGDCSPPLNTNEQLAVSCLGIRDDAEQRARSPRNEWCLSAQQEPHTLNHRSTHAYAPITVQRFSRVIITPRVWWNFPFQMPRDIQTNKHNCRPILKFFLIEFVNTSREDKADCYLSLWQHNWLLNDTLIATCHLFNTDWQVIQIN